MAAKPESSKAEHKMKKFGKSERSIPHYTQKAKKFYPAEDEAKPKKVREAVPTQCKGMSIDMVVPCCSGRWYSRNAHNAARMIPPES